jgi:DMSO/TMAO reductase YedYZ molybdopterin-dependent catalytic subunit
MEGASEVIFRGADSGSLALEGSSGSVRFERALSVEDARGSEALLAYAMNGEPLPVEHGYPLRLIVPGWYAVASVKWLTGIEVSDSHFEGFFQTDRYIYEWERDGTSVREPVRLQQVRSIITEPSCDEEVAAGALVIRGVAWSGAAAIDCVDICIGDGPWQHARLVGERQPHRWQWWELLTHLDEPGPTTIRARATDLAGRTQPDRAAWNRLGYGANAIHSVQMQLR